MFIMEEDFTGFNGTNKSVGDMKEKLLKKSPQISLEQLYDAEARPLLGFWIVSQVSLTRKERLAATRKRP